MLNRMRSDTYKYIDGFTLAELLVVVAIIGILVAVSIPIFSSQTEKAKVATDQANMRAAKVAAVAQYLTDGATGEKTYYYDAASGTVKDSENTDVNTITGYGKSSKEMPEANNTIPCEDGKSKVVVVTFNGEGTPSIQWGAGTSISNYYQNVKTIASTIKNVRDQSLRTAIFNSEDGFLKVSSSEIFTADQLNNKNYAGVPSTLYWKPKYVIINGKSSLILYACPDDTDSDNWNAYAFYYDGVLYQSSSFHSYTKKLQSINVVSSNFTDAINGTSTSWTKVS